MNNHLITLLKWDPTVQVLIIGELEIVCVDACDQILQLIFNDRLLYSHTVEQ